MTLHIMSDKELAPAGGPARVFNLLLSARPGRETEVATRSKAVRSRSRTPGFISVTENRGFLA